MKRFLLSLFIAVPILSFSQSNFRKGYVVTNANDTIKGYINYKERAINPSSITFKSSLEEKASDFNLQNCAGYGIDGLEQFQRFQVAISMSKVDVSSLSLGRDSASRTDTVFLNVLQAGKNVTLYGYRDMLKSRFYIKDKNHSVPQELIYQLYMNPVRTSLIVTENLYAGQLLDLMSAFNAGTESDLSNLKQLRYTASDLLKVVSVINNQKLVKSKYPNTRFFAGAGFNVNKVDYQGINDLANASAKNKSSSSPLVTMGLDVFANPAIGKTIFRLELALYMSKNNVSTTTANVATAEIGHTFDQKAVAFTPQVIYNFYNTDPLKVFAGAGIGFVISSFTNNQSTNFNSFRQETEVIKNNVELEAFGFTVPFRAGVVINKKIELSAVYTLPSTITNYTGYSITLQRFSVGVNFLFGK